MRQLGGSDHLWFAIDTRNSPMHLLMVNIYAPGKGRAGKTNLKTVKKYIDRRIGNLPLREKLVKVPFNLDYPYWVEDKDFDLDNHIFHIKLAARRTWDNFMKTLEGLARPSLDLSRPLWEMHLITGLGGMNGFPRGSYALALKVHHAQFDGTNLIKLVAKLHSDPPPAGAVSPGSSRPKADPSRVGLLVRAAWNNYAWGWRSAWTVGKNLPNFISTARAARESKAEGDSEQKLPKTRFSAVIRSRARVFDSVDLPMVDINTMRRKIDGATVNDAALAVAGGALRRYLDAHGELPNDPVEVACPVSAHAEDEQHETGNKGSLILVKLYTNVADPLERLALITQSTRRAKRNSEQMGAANVAGVVDLLPTNLLSYGMDLVTRTPLAEKINVGAMVPSGIGISNVPGSREPLYFDGDKLIKGLGVGFLVDGAGLLMVITSYEDTLQVQFLSTPDIMPDPKYFKTCIEEAFQEMCEAHEAQ